MTALFWFLALTSLANAFWMLAAPLHWYARLPAEVPDFGPFSEHFVRDAIPAYVPAFALAVAAHRLCRSPEEIRR